VNKIASFETAVDSGQAHYNSIARYRSLMSLNCTWKHNLLIWLKSHFSLLQTATCRAVKETVRAKVAAPVGVTSGADRNAVTFNSISPTSGYRKNTK